MNYVQHIHGGSERVKQGDQAKPDIVRSSSKNGLNHVELCTKISMCKYRAQRFAGQPRCIDHDGRIVPGQSLLKGPVKLLEFVSETSASS